MKTPGQRPPEGRPATAPPDDAGARRINLGEHSAGSAAATIRKVGELLGYVVVASGPASFRLTRPVRRGIRRVDQVVSILLTNDRDGLWVAYEGPLDTRLVDQLEAEAKVDVDDRAPSTPAPVANLPRADRDRGIARIEVRPGVAPQGLIDSVPGMPDVPPPVLPGGALPPPRLTTDHGLSLRFPDGRMVSGDVGLVLGRDPDVSLQPRCQTRVVVDDAGISKTHVAVWVDEDAIMIEDLHSTNGSECVASGETLPCEPGKPVRVPADRVELVIGSTTVVVERTI